MTLPNGQWRVRDRAAFIACLTETGDVRAATQAAGRCLVSAFRLRDADPEFASAWAQAVDHAWEVLEGAMLGGLMREAGALTAPAPPSQATAGPPADPPLDTVAKRASARPAAPTDWKLVLAALAQRPRPAARGRNRVDGAAVAKLRAEIAALPRAPTPATTTRTGAASP